MHSLEILEDLAVVLCLNVSSPLHYPFQSVVNLSYRVHQSPDYAFQTFLSDDVLVSQPVNLIFELSKVFLLFLLQLVKFLSHLFVVFD